MEFKVGNFIKGTDRSDYCITNKNMTKGEVVEDNDDGYITITILEHTTRPDEAGRQYEVESKYFDLWEDENTIQPLDLKPKHKFKVGDTVRIIEEKAGGWEDYVGVDFDIIGVIKINADRNDYLLEGSIEYRRIIVREEQLELVDNAEWVDLPSIEDDDDDDYVMPTKPVTWNLTLTFKDTDQYLHFIKKLMKYERTVNKGRLPFEYYVMPQEDWSVEVTINRCWADNLKDMAKLLSDVEYEPKKGKK